MFNFHINRTFFTNILCTCHVMNRTHELLYVQRDCLFTSQRSTEFAQCAADVYARANYLESLQRFMDVSVQSEGLDFTPSPNSIAYCRIAVYVERSFFCELCLFDLYMFRLPLIPMLCLLLIKILIYITYLVLFAKLVKEKFQ